MAKINRIMVLILLAFLLPNNSMAAQNSQVVPIGYSQEGRYFAYEEFGLDDESGIGFSKIYMIDLVEITHVVGTPILFRDRVSEQSLIDIRATSLEKARSFLQSLQIRQPAITAAVNGDGQIEREKNSLEFGLPIFDTTRKVSGKYNLSLESFETASAEECTQYMENKPLGFRLTMENFGASREIYSDRILARSRECPIGYEIYGVILPFGATDISKSVALISTLTRGAAGTDRHFIAIPLGFGL